MKYDEEKRKTPLFFIPAKRKMPLFFILKSL